MTGSTLRAPRLLQLSVSGVHLYNDGDTIDVDLEHPITALVGANGIGKSTLLALINFGITGIVPDETVTFQSVEEFVADTGSFARNYFDGRVAERHRRTATVRVKFAIGLMTFEVERGLFDGGNVRSYRIAGPDSDDIRTSTDGTSASDATIAYRQAVVSASNLASYDQFCFWQLFMMTFDERRHLLFWDERTLQSSLMIPLGHSPQDAVRAEKLSRDIERKESLARNARWRATQATNKRSRLLEDSAPERQLSEEDLLQLRERSDTLVQLELTLRQRFDASETELRDSSRSLAEYAIAESELEARYLERFAGPAGHRHPLEHPIFLSVTSDGSCAVCGSASSELSPTVHSAVEHGDCPICGSVLRSVDTREDDEADLLRLDAELAEAKRKVQDARMRVQRLRADSAEAARDWRKASDDLSAFLADNSDKLVQTDDAVIAAEIRRYDEEIAEAMRETADYRTARDESRRQLEPIISGLVEAYSKIETIFVPNFQRLAEKFIGRSVDVEFERQGVSIRLRFSLDGQTRRAATELSESQQFFLDIALRMSIIETFVEGTSTLLVDTPEGSLDIAYETRAGLLFGRFVAGDNCLVLMNNLNSSNLLKQLTEQSSPADMAIFKMIEWARLSDVQIESAPLFDGVYKELIASLNDPGATT